MIAILLDRFLKQEHDRLPMRLFATWSGRESFLSFLLRWFLDHSTSQRALCFGRTPLSGHRAAPENTPSSLARRISPAYLDHVAHVYILGLDLGRSIHSEMITSGS